MAAEMTPAAEFFSVLSDLLVAGAAIGAAISGVRALDSWRDQIHGAARFDAAKRLMVAANALGLQFHSARSPLLLAAEFPDWYHQLPRDELTGEQAREAYEHVLNARWRPVREACSQVLALLPEAQALFPAAVGDAAESLLKTAGSLQFWFGEYIEHQKDLATFRNAQGPAAAHLRESRQDAERHAFAPNPKRDEEPKSPLTIDFLSAHRRLADELAPYLQPR